MEKLMEYDLYERTSFNTFPFPSETLEKKNTI